MVDYVVEYEGDAESILRRVFGRDQGLGPLQRRFDFRLLMQQSNVIVLSLTSEEKSSTQSLPSISRTVYKRSRISKSRA
jgi:hypothetical protein